MSTAYLTQEGFTKLQDELEYLRTVRRQEVAKRLREALEDGDAGIDADAECDAARNEQAFVEGRIREIETILSIAKMIDDNGKNVPTNLMELDTKFASQLFDIQNAKRMIKEAQKNKDELTEDVYWDRLDVANRLADECKSRIQMIFNDTFGA